VQIHLQVSYSITIMKRMRSGSTMKIEHECIYLNLMLTHGTPKR
jgi:hypothetical protein